MSEYKSFKQMIEENALRQERETEEKIKEFCFSSGLTYVEKGLEGRQELEAEYARHCNEKAEEDRKKHEAEEALRRELIRLEKIQDLKDELASIMPTRYKGACVTDFKDSDQKKAIMNGSSALILGNNSTGKTRFKWALCKYWVDKGERVLITKAQKLLSDIKRQDDPYDYIEHKFGKGAAHLVIDEGDKIFESKADFVYLNYLIDFRYEWMLQTIFIGNGDTQSFINTLGQSIFSRLAGEGGVSMVLQGKDWRFKED